MGCLDRLDYSFGKNMFAGHCSEVDAVPIFKIERRVFESCLFKISVVAHKYLFREHQKARAFRSFTVTCFDSKWRCRSSERGGRGKMITRSIEG